MKRLKTYKVFETTNWGKLATDLLTDYWNKVDEENRLSELLEDVKDVILPLSDRCQETEFEKALYIIAQKNIGGRPVKREPDSWSRKGLTQITTDGKTFHTVKERPISDYDHESAYTKFVEVKSFVGKAGKLDSGWFGVDIIFRKMIGDNLDKVDIKTLQSEILTEFEEIRDNLESRGWWINSRGWGDDFVFDMTGGFSFDIIRPVSFKFANDNLTELVKPTIATISEGKIIKLFEAYPPSQFEIEAERKFRRILPDLEDILLEASDLGIQYDISKTISEVLFELRFDIHIIETKEQKKVVGEVVERINDYLNDSGIEFSSALIVQYIRVDIQPVDIEKHYVYDINEVIDLSECTGSVRLNLNWFWNNERGWQE